MSTPLPSFDAERFQQLLLGQLPVAEVERLAIEFFDDERLSELAHSLRDSDDAFVQALLHHQPLQDASANVLVERLIQKLCLPSAKHDTVNDSTATSGSVVPVPTPIPERIECFQIVKILGEGGMGRVYLAEDPRLNRRVALKTLRRDVAEKPGAVERFLREARNAAQLDHDHVVPIYHVGEADGTPFLTMPVLQGEALSTRLRRAGGQGLPLPEVILILRQIAAGLACAHSFGVIHRDVKPSNVWLESRPDSPPLGYRVKLLDFGLARGLSDEISLTSSGVFVGTPAYVAPEQARGLHVDARADLFSLGCVLYETLTGKRAFTGSDAMAILTSLAVDHPTPPHEIRRDCPPALSALTMRLLAKNPNDRPASANEVMQVLSHIDLAPTEQLTLKEETVSAPRAILSTSRRRTPMLVALAAMILLPLGWWLGMTLFRLETKDGTLVVELADGVEARIKNGEVHLLGPDGKVKYVLKPSEKNRAAIAPGDYRISVVGVDGLTLDTSKFEIKQGGLVTVRVTPEKSMAEKKVAVVPPNDPDRQAAEVVLSLGGKIDVNGGQNAERYKTSADLPKRRFRLTFVSLQGNPRVNDPSIACFEHCRHLLSLRLSYSPVTSDTLAHFRNCRELRELFLNGTSIDDAGLAHFKDCKQLTSLDVQSTRVTDAGLVAFKDHDQFQALGLGFTSITDVGLAYFKNNKRLQRLVLADTVVTDAGMIHFKDCKQLILLNLQQTSVTDQGVSHFKDNLGLKDLNLSHTKISDAGLAHFKNCKQLGSLNLAHCPNVTDAGLSYFKDCEHVTSLSIGPGKVSDAGVSHFKRCKNWISLSLYGTQVSDEGLAQLQGFEHLSYLDLNDTRVSDASLLRFKDSKNLTMLGLGGTRVTDTGLIHLQGLTRLSALNLARLNVTDAGFARFKASRQLSWVYLHGTNITDVALEQLKECKSLKFVDLRKTKVTLAGVNRLEQALPQCKIELD